MALTIHFIDAISLLALELAYLGTVRCPITLPDCSSSSPHCSAVAISKVIYNLVGML